MGKVFDRQCDSRVGSKCFNRFGSKESETVAEGSKIV